MLHDYSMKFSQQQYNDLMIVQHYWLYTIMYYIMFKNINTTSDNHVCYYVDINYVKITKYLPTKIQIGMSLQ